MRYYDDGDLTEGLQIATTPLGCDFLAGDYHVVWTYCNGRRSTLDWSSDLAHSQWDFNFRHAEGQDERQFNVTLHFGSLDLEFTLDYKDSIVNHLKLAQNNAPGPGSVEDDAVLTFSNIRDEAGYPYLRCNFATNEASPDEDMMNIEFVAKRTDPEGIHQLGFTKNEKLRLGYPVWDDGTFEPEGSDDEINNYNPDSLNKQLQRHVEATVKLHAKLVTIQNNISKQVTNATHGMHKAMEQAMRSVPNMSQSYNTRDGETPNSPPRKRRKTAVVGVVDDPDIDTPPSQRRRRKGGPESTPISMEHEEAARTGSGPVKRRRGSNLHGPGSRGGRGGKRKSDGSRGNGSISKLANYLVDLVRPEDSEADDGV